MTGIGWSECAITIGDKSCKTSFSYWYDPLGELAKSVEKALTGTIPVTFKLGEDFGSGLESFWTFTPTANGDSVHIHIVEFIFDFGKPDPEWESTIIMDAVCTKRDFAKAFLTAARAAWEKHGHKDYWYLWARKAFFPRKTCRRICEWLEKNEYKQTVL